MTRIIFIFAFVVCMAWQVTPANADYYFWRDPGSDLTLTFPDTWKIVNNKQPDDVVTIMAPSGRGQAMCRVRVRDDQRYMIYPPRYYEDIQLIDFSYDFWDQYIREYKNAQIRQIMDGAGLGRGFASYILASYESAVPGPFMSRRALMFASLYAGNVYVLECSAHKDAFQDWKGLFLSVAASVDFEPVHHQLTTGHYRNFMNDPRLEFKGQEGENVVLY